MKTYSFWHGFLKTITNVAIIGLPVVAQLLPSNVLNFTVGGIIYMAVNFLKVKNQIANE